MPKDAAYLAAEKKIQQALQSGATELDLSGMELTELPASLGQLTQLTSLNLSNNQLTTLPASLGQLTQLTELDFAKCNLSSLPEWMERCDPLKKNLRILRANGCPAKSLPDWLGDFTNLQRLSLEDMGFSELPTSIERLVNLEYLTVYGNRLTNLPTALLRLKKLTTGLSLKKTCKSAIHPVHCRNDYYTHSSRSHRRCAIVDVRVA